MDDPNLESWLLLLANRQLQQRLAKMAAARQLPVDELATNLLETAVSAWEETQPTSWTIPLIDTGDGSGDGMVELPAELLAQTGWVEGDVLSFEDGGNGKLLIRKVDNEDAELAAIAHRS